MRLATTQATWASILTGIARIGCYVSANSVIILRRSYLCVASKTPQYVRNVEGAHSPPYDVYNLGADAMRKEVLTWQQRS